MYYETHGPADARPVVLLHGGTATIQLSFSKQIDILARAHRVIGIEQMGHGHTPDLPDREFSYEAMAEDTAGLLRAIGVTNADVVGWSDGGQVALRLAIVHPELVRRVVASGVGLGSDPNPAKRAAAEAISDSRWPREFKDEYARTSPDGVSHWPVVWRKAARMWARPSWGFTEDELKKIQSPALIIAGDHDIVSAELTRRIAKRIPNGKALILPSTDHWTFQKNAQVLNPILLDFLDRP